MSVREKQRAVIEFLTAENTPPIEIHRRMKAVYGDECIDISNVRRWAARARKSGPNLNVCDRARSGRPRTATDETHRNRVDQLIRENRRITQAQLSLRCGISRERVQALIAELRYRKVCARWVPRMLTPDMKQRRMDICQQLLLRFEQEGDGFLNNIVTGDESWVHHFDPLSKRASLEYRHHGSPPPRKCKTMPSAGKIMLTVFWDVRGVVHMEFMPKGTTINSARYSETLRKLKARIRRTRPHMEHPLLQHDNARPHTSAATSATIRRLGFTVIDHPPYSPDLAPSDFHLFPKLKEHLRGVHFTTDEAVQAEVRLWFRQQGPNFYSDGIHKLVSRWEKCVRRQGDYVEK